MRKKHGLSITTLRSWVAAIIILMTARAGVAQDSLVVARDLYTAAEFEEALKVLNGLKVSAQSPADSHSIEQYRAFCLIALGRKADAERAIEAIVAVEPSYHPSDTSPHVRSAFSEVRRRVLPGIIQQKYAAAKTAFSQKDRAEARNRFTQVLELLADADVAIEANQPPLSEIRKLASEFRELSTPAPPPAVAPPPKVAPATPPPRPAPPIYGPNDANVVLPIVVRESFSGLADVFALRAGVVEVIIDETGAVETATIRVSVNPVYDRLAQTMAKSWRYRPATVNGIPVKFRKIVYLDLKAAR